MNFNDNGSEYHSSNTGCDYEIYSNTSLPENLNFSLDEIRQQLNLFGYTEIPDDKLLSIKKDLDEIIARDDSLKNSVRTPRNRESNDWFIEGSNSEYDNDDSSIATVTSLSPNSYRMKRKTIRKRNTLNTDDFVSETNTSRTCDSDSRINNNGDNYFRKVSFPQDPVEDVFNYTGVSINPSDLNPHQNLSKQSSTKTSFIKPTFRRFDNTWQRHDPVSRYHSYKAAWNEKKAPGESPHKQLRWAVKAAMMVKEVPKPRITRINSARTQNQFLPPGENKRSDLRWQIRQELATPDVFFD